MCDRWGVYLSIYFKSLFTNVKFWNNYCKALALDFKHYECKLMRHVLSFLEKKNHFLGGVSRKLHRTNQCALHM